MSGPEVCRAGFSPSQVGTRVQKQRLYTFKRAKAHTTNIASSHSFRDSYGHFDPKSQWGGYLTAIDADSGKVAWKFRAPTPMLSGVTTTAGGLVFAGDLNGDVRAFDVKTGRVLRT